MRWPGIRDGNRRQGFFKGKGTGHDATSRHTGSRRARQRGHSGTTQGARQHPQRPRRTMTISVHGGRHKIRTDKTRPDDRAWSLASLKDRRAECCIPGRFDRSERPLRPPERRTPQGTPLQRGFRWRRRAEHPTRHPTAFVADFDGLANVPVIPGHP